MSSGSRFEVDRAAAAEQAYRKLGSLLANAPELQVLIGDRVDPEIMSWLARASAVVGAFPGGAAEYAKLTVKVDSYVRASGQSGADEIIMSLTRVLAIAELQAPSGVHGSFVSAGSPFDSLAAISKVLGGVRRRALIIDPYMDERALTEFAVLLAEGTTTHLLTDAGAMRPGLAPAGTRWTAQYQQARPLSVRAAPARALHDRLILVDDTEAWILTQSLKDFAVRSPATLEKTSPELAALKIAAYEQIWQSASIIV